MAKTSFLAASYPYYRHMHFQPCTYMTASARNGTIYTGVTSHLMQRIYQHREGTFGGFSAAHKVHRLVAYDLFGTMEAAIAREKQWKNWRRAWKVARIEADNPTWRDLAEDFGFEVLEA